MTYTVKPGDTLYGISNQYGVSVVDLANLNNVTAKTLQIGDVLTIPSKDGINPDNMFMYTVVKGDTLYKIAQKYNTTVQDIINLNNLKTNNLYIGQVLRIPENYNKEDEIILKEFINYTVKKGDSLYSIAKKNNITVDDIIKDNGLKDNNLKIGQNLKIRVNDDTILECFGPDYIVPETNYLSYTVKKGDNLYSISRNYNTTVNEILNLNNLSNANLSVGQVLKIPTSSTTYTVKSGDSLYSIAKKFNTTVNDIKIKNNLSSNLLKIGQILKV